MGVNIFFRLRDKQPLFIYYYHFWQTNKLCGRILPQTVLENKTDVNKQQQKNFLSLDRQGLDMPSVSVLLIPWAGRRGVDRQMHVFLFENSGHQSIN